MNSLIKAATMAAVVLGLTAPAAEADVIFNFDQVGPFQGGSNIYGTSRPDLALMGNLVVSDEAAAKGFSFTLTNNTAVAAPKYSNLTGLIGFEITSNNPRVGATFSDFFTVRGPGSGYFAILSISGSASTGLSGTFTHSDNENDLRYSFSGASFSGSFISDLYASCGGPACTFSGNTFTSVPEPASIALFGAGLLGLAGVMRRRAS